MGNYKKDEKNKKIQLNQIKGIQLTKTLLLLMKLKISLMIKNPILTKKLQLWTQNKKTGKRDHC